MIDELLEKWDEREIISLKKICKDHIFHNLETDSFVVYDKKILSIMTSKGKKFYKIHEDNSANDRVYEEFSNIIKYEISDFLKNN